MSVPFDFAQFAEPYGYTDDASGIAAAQADYGLEPTGKLDGVTVNVLTRIPRCGCSDAQPVAGQINRWGIPVVSYFIESYPGGIRLSTAQVELVVAAALGSWSEVCGLKFAKAPDAERCNLLMGTARGRRNNFDGPGGTLAWCQIPQGNNYRGQLLMMWDMDEAFTVEPNSNGILLRNVTAHEIGHGIGLFHNNQPNQLLNPVYNPRIATPQSYEIGQVVERYGKPQAAPAPSPGPIKPGVGSYPKAVKIQCEDGSIYAGSLSRLQ